MNFDFSIFRKAKKAAADELQSLDLQIANANAEIAKHSSQTANKTDLKTDFNSWLATCHEQVADLAKRNLNPRQNTLRKNGPLFVIRDDRGDVNPAALLALLGATAGPSLQKIVHGAIDAMVYDNESALSAAERATEINRATALLGELHEKRAKLIDEAAAAGLSLE